VDADGGNPLQLTNGGGEWWPNWSPDSRWVVYTSFGLDGWASWKVSVEGGDPVPLSNISVSRPAVSPDGKLIACFYKDVQAKSQMKVAILPFEGGALMKTLDIAPTANTNFSVRWTADGRALTYVDARDGTSEIWSLPIDGGSPKPMTNFKSQRIFYFDWTRDGKNLVCARGAETTNVVLIRQASEND
jgi:Tol biopolymer transport system component